MQPDTLILAAMIVWLGNVAVSRYLGEKSFRLLDDSQRLKLVDGFSGYRSATTYIQVGMVAFLLLVAFYRREWFDQFFSYFLIGALILQVVAHRVAIGKLELLNLPQAYVQSWRVRSLLSQSLNIVFFAMIYAAVVWSE